MGFNQMDTYHFPTKGMNGNNFDKKHLLSIRDIQIDSKCQNFLMGNKIKVFKQECSIYINLISIHINFEFTD